MWGINMKIKCDDTMRAQRNLEAAVNLGRKHAGVFGYTEIVKENGELYVRYRSGTGFHGLPYRCKIVLEENYIFLKDARSLRYHFAECFILLCPIVYLLLVIGEFILSNIFALKFSFDFPLIIASFWIIGVLKFAPMHYIKKYVKSKVENK